MAEVPRIVRERLREQAVAGEHPDANLLSAFAERTLTEPERTQMLDHLSRCADCRDVAALAAQSQVEEGQLVPAAQAARRSWWRSPVIHWSALTAAALVVLIAVGERMRLRQEYSASAPAIAKTDTKLEPVPAQPALEQRESQKSSEATAQPRRTQALNRPGVAAGAGGGRFAAGSGAAVTAPAAAPAAPPPAPAEAKKLQSSAATEGQAYDQARKFDQPQLKSLPVPSAKAAAPRVAPSSGTVAGGPVSAPSGQSTMVTQFAAGNFVRRAFVGPRWSVSDSGTVQRSFDGGQSWKEVAVAEGVNFRAVAAMVNDIWAGGSGGALFHSTDGGEHWTRVQVQANDRALSGDITRIEHADAQNVVVTISTGETWGTSNSGASWEQR